MGIIEKTVFISYRRKHVPWALSISKHLTSLGYDVFFDYVSIGSGDFGQVISENVKARAHFLVLLAPSSLEGCEKEEDWLRKEIELAIETKRNIVPIMLEGFDFGSPETRKYLTGSLETLNHYNGLSLPAEYFDAAMDRLCGRFLNVALSEVHIPVSTKVQKEVRKQQEAIALADPVSEETLSAWEWFEKALLIKEMDEKIRLYSKAIELNENFAWAYNNRGNCFSNLRNHERAIIDFNNAIRHDPKFAVAYNNRGISYDNLNQFELAVLDYSEAIRLDPRIAAAYNNRGISYRKLNQYEKAIDDYNVAIKLDPEYAAAYCNRGVSLQNLKKYELAILDYSESLRLKPDFGTPYFNLACAYAIQEQVSESLKWLQKAISMNKEKYCNDVKTDSDFDAIREEPEFQQLMAEFCNC